jgi:antitoxin component YwqK of YwqJK toxin-antitoxin module
MNELKKVEHYYNRTKKQKRRNSVNYTQKIQYVFYVDKNNKTQGDYKEYYRSGNLLSVGNYIDNKREGLEICYFDDNQKTKRHEIMYHNDVRQGISIYYYGNGMKGTESTYHNNLLQGQYITYYLTGMKKTEYTCVNGKREGKLTTYFGEGTVESIQYYKNDKLHGTSTFYALSSTPYTNYLTSIQNHENGLAEGVFIQYCDCGKKKEEYYLHRDLQEGKRTTWYECKDIIKSIVNYEAGNVRGELKYWRENGNLYCWKYYMTSEFIVWKDIKHIVKRWKLLTKFIILKKERRMKLRLKKVRKKITHLNILVYTTIMSYLTWDETMNIIRKFESKKAKELIYT